MHCASASVPQARVDSIIGVLKNELAHRKDYDDKKEVRIRQLKEKLNATAPGNYNAQYDLCRQLYEEYKVYQFDSAYVYTQKLLRLALISTDLSKVYDTKIKLAFILLSSGMFKETFECLNQINTKVLSDNSRLEYYTTKSRAYSDLAEYNGDKAYAVFDQKEAIKYIDSAIAIAPPRTFERLSSIATKEIETGQLQTPSQEYIDLLQHYQLSEHHRAMVATGLSSFYTGPNQESDRMFLMAEGAINDIRSSTKETTAIFKLGWELYLKGNVVDAYTFINQAMDDAQFYGARLRKVNIGAVLPIVAAQRNILTEKEKDRFLAYFVSITVVAIIISSILFIVFYQFRRLKTKEKIIEEKNILLEKINGKLSEDTHIKEEYIGYFFNVISGYILKLEKLKRSVERKITTKKYDDVLLSVNEINIKKERETLFYTFDHIFLKIFPNFIASFNAMFKEEDQIWPRDHEVLNTDLRIFALMRLGINDNETIANILEYSVNTIYVYKMRIKAKALVPGDQFDHRIMDIKAVDILNKS
jgi:tetratricopeptide (TPR) repeat protein